MSIGHILDNLISLIPFSEKPSPNSGSNAASNLGNSLDPAPGPETLCASASLLNELTGSSGEWAKGLKFFRAEAIPLANVSVSTSSINFGDVRIGSTQSRYFSITNNSDCPLNFNISGIPSGFSVGISSGTISAHGSLSVNVSFTPNNEQSYSGYINVYPGSGSVYVSGKGKKN